MLPLAENMGFLDSNAQTFLGVILTLTVLCIFASNDSKDGGDSNFIFRLLTQQWKKLEVSFTSLFNAVADKMINFQNSKEYKTLSTDVYDDKGNAELYLFGLQILMRFKDSTNDIKTDSSPLLIILDRIKRSNEQFRAPFFTLMFGIVMLTLNLIASWCDDVSVIMPGIWIFAVLSVIYWIALWTAFLCHNMEDKDKDDEGKCASFWKMIDDRFSWHKGSLCKILACATVAVIVLLAVDVTMFSSALSFVIVALLLLLVITVIGVWRVVSCDVKGNYSAMHTIGHLAAFFIYSVVMCAVYDLWGRGVCDGLFENKDVLAGVVVFFSLLNGIISPFVFPYLKYRSPFKKSMNEVHEWDNKLDSAIKVFNGGFGEWTKKYFFASKAGGDKQTTISGNEKVIYEESNKGQTIKSEGETDCNELKD